MRDVFDIWVGQVSKKLLSLTITTTLVFRRCWWGARQLRRVEGARFGLWLDVYLIPDKHREII